MELSAVEWICLRGWILVGGGAGGGTWLCTTQQQEEGGGGEGGGKKNTKISLTHHVDWFPVHVVLVVSFLCVVRMIFFFFWHLRFFNLDVYF